jgi:homocitrate synthase
MVAVEGKRNGLSGSHGPNSTAHSSGANGHSATKQRRNPYAPRASDFLNNVSNFKIIESTLRGFCLYRSGHILSHR